MRKKLTIILTNIILIISCFAFFGCDKKEGKNENLWYCYKIWELGSGTMVLREEEVYTIEFFPESETCIFSYDLYGDTSEDSYVYSSGSNGIFLYSKSGTLIGTFQIDGDEATLSYIDLTRMEYFQRDPVVD